MAVPSWTMSLCLRVRERAWHQSIVAAAADLPGLIPVVKGNGYGFDRSTLMPIAARLSTEIAVGSVYEAADVPADRTAIVLTPHIRPLPRDLPAHVVLTVGRLSDVEALHRQGWTGAVSIKLQSSMKRFGATPTELANLVIASRAAGLNPTMYGLHLALAGDQDRRESEVDRWLDVLDEPLPLGISHVDSTTYARLRARHPNRQFRVRVGTALWHADKSTLRLSADVLDVHPVSVGETVGYRARLVPGAGHVVVVGAGSAHGVHPLDDGRSPFHFGKCRMQLIEGPHMHSSLAFVASGDPCPVVGEQVDVQRPLIDTAVDELEWVRD